VSRGTRGETVEYGGYGGPTGTTTSNGMRDTYGDDEVRDSLAEDEGIGALEPPGVTSWEGPKRRLANHQQNLPKPSLIKGHSDFNEGFVLRE